MSVFDKMQQLNELQLQVEELQSQLAQAKIDARWRPRIEVQQFVDSTKVSLMINGQVVTQTLSAPLLSDQAVSAEELAQLVLEQMVKSLMISQFKPSLVAELSKVQQGALAAGRAGKW